MPFECELVPRMYAPDDLRRRARARARVSERAVAARGEQRHPRSRARAPDVVDGQPDAARGLGDVGALLQGVVDALDRVVLHGDEEAGGELGPGRPRVEQRRRGVREVPGARADGTQRAACEKERVRAAATAGCTSRPRGRRRTCGCPPTRASACAAAAPRSRCSRAAGTTAPASAGGRGGEGGRETGGEPRSEQHAAAPPQPFFPFSSFLALKPK